MKLLIEGGTWILFAILRREAKFVPLLCCFSLLVQGLNRSKHTHPTIQIQYININQTWISSLLSSSSPSSQAIQNWVNNKIDDKIDDKIDHTFGKAFLTLALEGSRNLSIFFNTSSFILSPSEPKDSEGDVMLEWKRERVSPSGKLP